MRTFICLAAILVAAQVITACGDFPNDNPNMVVQVTTTLPDNSQLQVARMAKAKIAWQMQFEKPAMYAEVISLLGPQNEAVEEIICQLVYPTDEQLAENAKDSAEAARSIASLHQVMADDEANLRYVETHGVPISAVHFKVLPEQEQDFMARWSTPVGASTARFQVIHPFTGRIINPAVH